MNYDYFLILKEKKYEYITLTEAICLILTPLQSHFKAYLLLLSYVEFNLHNN